MPSPAVALRISGVGHRAAGFETLLQQGWGYSPVRDGDDWVVLATDTAFQAPPRDVLNVHGPLPLTKEKRHKLAGKLLTWIPGQFDEYISQNAQPITFDFDEDSILNRVYACRTRLEMSPRPLVRGIIRDELLPLMADMGATGVYGVTVDANYQQAIYTHAKFGLLGKAHDVKEIEELIFERKALGGILPNALNLFAYVNALTRLAPIAYTLPVRHGDCAWHFVSPKRFVFKHSVFCEGLFQQFIDPIVTVSEDINILPAVFGSCAQRVL